MNFAKSHWQTIDTIAGWLSYPAAFLSSELLELQRSHGEAGNLLEFGVYKGKYLALLYGATRSPSERVVGVDAFLAGYGRPLEEQWIENARREMVEAVERVNHRSDGLLIHRQDTRTLDREALLRLTGGEVRFASIDAGHDYEDVVNDLTLVDGLLTPGGIIALDDVFNPIVPGVTQGFCEYLRRSEDLKPFAFCGNKMFVCRPPRHATYREFVERLVSSSDEAIFAASSAQLKRDREIGFTPHMFGVPVVAVT